MGTSDRETKILNPEVTEKPGRRQFAAAYKLQVLEQAGRCSSLGEIGALLRREGLYSSHLSNWRRERRKGALASMSATTRGRPAVRSAEQREIERLRRNNERLRGKLAKAEKIIDVQKNSPRCLGLRWTARRGGGERMSAVRQLRSAVGVRTACQALGLSRSGYYRRQRPPRKRTEVPRTSLRALAGTEPHGGVGGNAQRTVLRPCPDGDLRHAAR